MKHRICAFACLLLLGVVLPELQAAEIGLPCPICTDPGQQGWSSACYNATDDMYLIAWEEYRNTDVSGSDIWGRLVNSDGSFPGDPFPICQSPSDQYWPKMVWNPHSERYLVVFDCGRNVPPDDTSWPQNRDIYGIFLDKDGNIVPIPTSEADGSFPICTEPSMQWYGAVDIDPMFGRALVVWADYRNYDMDQWNNIDIYGQFVESDGTLVLPPDMDVAVSPLINMPICDEPTLDQNVPDVSYCNWSAEFITVFAQGGMNASDISMWAQRVHVDGDLLAPDNSLSPDARSPFPVSVRPVAKASSSGVSRKPIRHSAARQVSGLHKALEAWTDSVQPRVQYNQEYIPFFGVLKPDKAVVPTVECLVVWTDERNMSDLGSNPDILCQRIGFLNGPQAAEAGITNWTPVGEGDLLMTLLDIDGEPEMPPWPNYQVCDALGEQWGAEVIYNMTDEEYLVLWSDRRFEATQQADIWGQRLLLDKDASMVWQDNAVAKAALTPDMPVVATPNMEWASIGIVHNSRNNKYLASFSFQDSLFLNQPDIHALFITGEKDPQQPPTVVTGLGDDFEDGVVSGYWVPEDDGGFVLSEEGGSLKIDVDKERGFAAVTFIPAPDFLVDMSANPYLSIKVKASADVKLQVGVTNSDQTGNPNATPPLGPNAGNENVTGGEDWKTFLFDFSTLFAASGTSGNRVDIVYFNFNPGNAGTDPTNAFNWSGTIWFDDLKIGDLADLTPQSVDNQPHPQAFALSQNYPNPFNPSTVIDFALPVQGDVYAAVYDVSGRLVRTLLEERREAGRYQLLWDGQNQTGLDVPSGVYVYRISFENRILSRKMILMR